MQIAMCVCACVCVCVCVCLKCVVKCIVFMQATIHLMQMCHKSNVEKLIKLFETSHMKQSFYFF